MREKERKREKKREKERKREKKREKERKREKKREKERKRESNRKETEGERDGHGGREIIDKQGELKTFPFPGVASMGFWTKVKPSRGKGVCPDRAVMILFFVFVFHNKRK